LHGTEHHRALTDKARCYFEANTKISNRTYVLQFSKDGTYLTHLIVFAVNVFRSLHCRSMIAVANPTLTTVSPAHLPLRPQGTGRKMSFSCIAPQRSEIDGLDSSTTSEFGISECYQRAEKIFLGPQASSVAAALLEPGKRRNTSRFVSKHFDLFCRVISIAMPHLVRPLQHLHYSCTTL